MRNTCMLSYWYDDKINKTYVNINNKIWITTQQQLLEICWNCDKYLTCDYVLRLFTLLSKNNENILRYKQSDQKQKQDETKEEN